MADSNKQIKFIENHLPPLKDGDYSIEVKQIFQVDGEEEETYIASKDFFVAGERFTINPQEILAIYPPSNAQSNYSLQPPYMAINRNTLPWERNVEPTDDTTPWLGLLCFTEDELRNITASTVTFADVKNPSEGSEPSFPGLEEEGSTSDDQLVQVIDVPVCILEPLLNNAEGLSLLGSARSSNNVERSYLMSNRLPVDGKQHTVYLVSFESRFEDGSFAMGDAENVRLVTLYSWSFTSTITYKVSAGILAEFSDEISDLLSSIVGQVYTSTDAFEEVLADLLKDQFEDNKDKLLEAFNYGNYVTTLKHADRSPSNFRLPPIPQIEEEDNEEQQLAEQQIEALLAKGYTTIPHKLREGSQSAAFYHGPFIPFKSSDTALTYPIMASDQVLSYRKDFGMFDIAYSSAWEMGRLITLEQTDIANALYQWKRSHTHQQKGQQQVIDEGTDHLPGALTATSEAPPIPQNVSNWFEQLKVLQNVPFSYLVPDEKMLPVESIRFFYIDNNWLDALLDGALSIGRTTTDDHKNDQEISSLINNVEQTVRSGVLIRSSVVAAWTDMQINGFSTVPDNEEAPIDSSNELPLLRMERLSPNIMLCLFEGNVATIDIHGKPEAPHYGVEKNDQNGYEKTLKDQEGIEDEQYVVEVPINDNNLIDLEAFKNNISSYYESQNKSFLWSDNPTSAEFSVQMLEGGEKIRFMIQNE
ncbi:MAG: hypothetical protein R8G66_03850 [Cytophagales bacterium]|nr:hypothetical protein [Cytophagales bacterium]